MIEKTPRARGVGTYPVILMRLPYDKSTAQTYVYASPEFYASHCYIVVIQDVRGQYASQGTFYAFRDEMNDGYDSVEWAAALPGSSGKVGMYGFSYVGATQWLAAVMQPPHLAAIVPAMTSSDYYDGWSYEGGAWSLAFEESWPIFTIALASARRTGDQSSVAKILDAAGKIAQTYNHLPLTDYPWLSQGVPTVAGYFYDWLAHDTWDDYWQQWSIRKRYERVQVPALNFAGWYDVFLNGSIENFVGMRKEGGSDVARSAPRLVIGPYIHFPWKAKVGDVDFGFEAINPIDGVQLAWLDRWLKGKDNGADREAAVRVFVMGVNRWRDAADWPIPVLTPPNTTCARSARRTRGSAMVGSTPMHRWWTSLRTTIAMIPATPCRAAAAILAARPRWPPLGRMTRPRSNSVPTFLFIRHLCCSSRLRSRVRSASRYSPHRARSILTGQRSS
jgi:uncharacterized protein